jgi:dynactin complex subunit
MSTFEVSQRVSDVTGSRGTVRYVGPVLTSKDQSAIWIGVEWDEVGRGKHDGAVTDKDVR